MSGKRLATRPSRRALMMGMPPATLASKRKWPPPCARAAKISAPCAQMQRLVGGDDDLAARERRQGDLARQRGAAHQLAHDVRSGVGGDGERVGRQPATARDPDARGPSPGSAPRPGAGSMRAPRRDSSSRAQPARRCFQTPWPTVPRPQRPMFNGARPHGCPSGAPGPSSSSPGFFRSKSLLGPAAAAGRCCAVHGRPRRGAMQRRHDQQRHGASAEAAAAASGRLERRKDRGQGDVAGREEDDEPDGRPNSDEQRHEHQQAAGRRRDALAAPEAGEA